MSAPDPQRLLAELEALVSSLPPRSTIRHETPENHEWFGRLSAMINAWDYGQGVKLALYMSEFRNINAQISAKAFRHIMDLLYQAKADLMLKTNTSPTQLVRQGEVFHYFDAVRRVIEQATSDLLFVDPYLDADFVSRYLPQAPDGVSVRLLTQHKPQAVVAAVQAYAAQHGRSASVRVRTDMHDRFVIVDRRDVHWSGASFKDGARKSDTVFSQVRDGAAPLRDLYEQAWSTATVLI